MSHDVTMKLQEVRAQLIDWLDSGTLTTPTMLGKASGMAESGLYFAKHIGTTKYIAFFLNAQERLARLRQTHGYS